MDSKYIPNPNPDAILGILKRIKESDAAGMRLRWQAGNCLLEMRGGKKRLPNGALNDLESKSGVSRRELQRYMRLAELYPSEKELRHCVAVHGNWHDVAMRGLRGPEPVFEEPEPDPDSEDPQTFVPDSPADEVQRAAELAEELAIYVVERFGDLVARERAELLIPIERVTIAWASAENEYDGGTKKSAKQLADSLAARILKRNAPTDEQEPLSFDEPVSFEELLEVS